MVDTESHQRKTEQMFYEQGYRAGYKGETYSCPHLLFTFAAIEWMCGYNFGVMAKQARLS